MEILTAPGVVQRDSHTLVTPVIETLQRGQNPPSVQESCLQGQTDRQAVVSTNCSLLNTNRASEFKSYQNKWGKDQRSGARRLRPAHLGTPQLVCRYLCTVAVLEQLRKGPSPALPVFLLPVILSAEGKVQQEPLEIIGGQTGDKAEHVLGRGRKRDAVPAPHTTREPLMERDMARHSPPQSAPASVSAEHRQ